MRFLFLTLFLTICFSVSGQIDAFQQKIIDCLHLNGTSEEYSKVYDQTLSVLFRQFETANVPEVFLKELMSDKSEEIKALIPSLAFGYRKHFTKDDITLMAEFYKTETAQLMLTDPDALTEDQHKEVNAFLESDIGLKIEAKKVALSKDLKEIASYWKRDLFAEKMGALVKNGYSPQ